MIAILFLILAVGCYAISQLQQHGALKWMHPMNTLGFWGEHSDERKYTTFAWMEGQRDAVVRAMQMYNNRMNGNLDDLGFERCPTCDGAGLISKDEYWIRVGNDGLNQDRHRALMDVLGLCRQFNLSNEQKACLERYRKLL